MNSRQRIAAVFAGEPVDRVLLFEQSIASSVASEILGRPALTGSTSLHREESEILLTGDADAYDEFIRKIYDDRAAIARELRHDALTLPWLLGAKPAKKLDEFNYLYGDMDSDSWALRRYDPDAQTFEIVDSSARDMTIEDVERAVENIEKSASDPKRPESLVERLSYIIENWGGEFEIFGGGGLSIPRHPAWLEATITHPDLVKRFLEAAVECARPSLEAQAELGIKVLWAGGDLAGNSGPLYSPKTFRELMVPCKRKLTDICHSLGLKYVFRTDGNLWPLGDDFFVNCGIDGYGEIDQDAGMDIVEVHRRYPGLALWGGVPCGSVLHRGKPDDVRRAARRSIEGVGSRLILGSSNSIVHGTPPENVFAMVETAFEISPEPPGCACRG